MSFTQSYRFGFEAAHELGANVAATSGHPYAHVHGHSFEATVFLGAEDLPAEGWIMDFAAVRAACDDVRGRLDHRLLNTIPGLERPTLEHLARFIFAHLEGQLLALTAVEVARPSLREAVRYAPSRRPA